MADSEEGARSVPSAAPTGIFSSWFGGGSSSSSSSSTSSTEGSAGSHVTQEMPVPQLKAIKTPHENPISHPELAFTPSDIGIWEINKEKKMMTGTPTAEQAKKAGRGFGFW